MQLKEQWFYSGEIRCHTLSNCSKLALPRTHFLKKKNQKQFSNFKHLMVTCENNIFGGKNARESDSFAFVGINIY